MKTKMVKEKIMFRKFHFRFLKFSLKLVRSHVDTARIGCKRAKLKARWVSNPHPPPPPPAPTPSTADVRWQQREDLCC